MKPKKNVGFACIFYLKFILEIVRKILDFIVRILRFLGKGERIGEDSGKNALVLGLFFVRQ